MVYNGGRLWYSTIYSMTYTQNYKHISVKGCENAFHDHLWFYLCE